MAEKEERMTALYGNNIREIVYKANDRGIKKEDVISLMKEDGQFILVYYSSNY